MGKQTKQQKEIKHRQDLRYEAWLAKAKVKLKKKKTTSRKKDYNFLLNDLKLVRYEKSFVRNFTKWVSSTYNLDRQRISFIQWVFGKYPIPNSFVRGVIGRIIIPDRRGQRTQDYLTITEIYLEWLIGVGRGDSFFKMVRGFMTKREAHEFLYGKSPNNDPTYNIWYSKCIINNIPKGLATVIADKLSVEQRKVTEDFWGTVIVFYSRYVNELNSNIINDTLDYLNTVNIHEFSMSKRTLASLIRLSNEWHREVMMLGSRRVNLTWQPLFDKTIWKYKTKDVEKKQYRIWRIMELTTAKQLIYEGSKQRHCVGSYSQLCSNGRIHMFTLDSRLEFDLSFEEKHVTIEVRDYKIKQVRGKRNRFAIKSERNIINSWANDLDISYDRISRYGY